MPLESSDLPSLGTAGAGSSLGSLSQSARGNQLKTARWIMIGVGILTVVVNGAILAAVEKLVDDKIHEEVNALHMRGQQEDPRLVAALRHQAVQMTRIMAGTAVALGFVFIGLGIFVNKYPVPATVLGLVLYISAAAIYGYLDPSTLANGAIIKVFIIIALVKSIQSAIAYQREASRPVRGPLASSL